MAENSAVEAFYNSNPEAKAGINELHMLRCEKTKLSIGGKNNHSEVHVVAYYNPCPHAGMGNQAAGWAGFGSLQFRSGFFIIPGIGPLMVFGPMVGWIVGALLGAPLKVIIP